MPINAVIEEKIDQINALVLKLIENNFINV